MLAELTLLVNTIILKIQIILLVKATDYWKAIWFAYKWKVHAKARLIHSSVKYTTVWARCTTHHPPPTTTTYHISITTVIS
jgi:hypothetical protein